MIDQLYAAMSAIGAAMVTIRHCFVIGVHELTLFGQTALDFNAAVGNDQLQVDPAFFGQVPSALGTDQERAFLVVYVAIGVGFH